mmetsp:Transcript_19190/g.47942  ORF Transcript_19190/g.47942 Transcript_19190/m.47942 type:complete len:513 (-) Transcript_19190:61-1599(-)
MEPSAEKDILPSPPPVATLNLTFNLTSSTLNFSMALLENVMDPTVSTEEPLPPPSGSARPWPVMKLTSTTPLTRALNACIVRSSNVMYISTSTMVTAPAVILAAPPSTVSGPSHTYTTDPAPPTTLTPTSPVVAILTWPVTMVRPGAQGRCRATSPDSAMASPSYRSEPAMTMSLTLGVPWVTENAVEYVSVMLLISALLASSSTWCAAASPTPAPPAPASLSSMVPSAEPVQASCLKVGLATPSTLSEYTLTLMSERRMEAPPPTWIVARSMAASMAYSPPAAACVPHRLITLARPSTNDPKGPNFTASVPEPDVPASVHALDACMLSVALMVSDSNENASAARQDPSRVSNAYDTSAARSPAPPVFALTEPETMPAKWVVSLSWALAPPLLAALEVYTKAWMLKGATVVPVTLTPRRVDPLRDQRGVSALRSPHAYTTETAKSWTSRAPGTAALMVASASTSSPSTQGYVKEAAPLAENTMPPLVMVWKSNAADTTILPTANPSTLDLLK